jgi:hypothetical protein
MHRAATAIVRVCPRAHHSLMHRVVTALNIMAIDFPQLTPVGVQVLSEERIVCLRANVKSAPMSCMSTEDTFVTLVLSKRCVKGMFC